MKTRILKRSKNKGFALIVTLSLMILLTIIAVGLLTLSSVSLRSTGQGDAMATARNNARMALMLAIGELQKSLGPDKAITATSGILSEKPNKPNLTGVWESWDFNPTDKSLDYNQEKARRFRRWLVSSADATETESLDFGRASWLGKTIDLVAQGALGKTAKDEQKATAGIVPISRNGRIQGSYAWHVADESVKARINLYRDPEQNQTLAQKRALLAGHRPNPSFIKSSTDKTKLDFLPNDYTKSDFQKALKDSEKVVNFGQVALLENAKEIQRFRNDVTPYSLGLLTDVRHGGLKQDLSSLFEMSTSAESISLPPRFEGQKLYQSMLDVSGISDPYWSSLSSYYNTFRSITGPESNPTFAKAPTEIISSANLNVPTKFYPGPVIAKIETVFSFVTRDSHQNWATTAQRPFLGHLLYTPYVTLHNPYNVSLSFQSLDIGIKGIPVGFQFYVNGAKQNQSLVPLSELYGTGGNGDKSFYLKITNSAGTGGGGSSPIIMKPGQTLLCSPYVNPMSIFGNGINTDFFDYKNDGTLTGSDGNPKNAPPGFRNAYIGYDVDWLTPPAFQIVANNADNKKGVLGLNSSDTVRIEFGLVKPIGGIPGAVTDKFQVTAKLTATSDSAPVEYGGLEFKYQDQATLDKLIKDTIFYPADGYPELKAEDAYAPNTQPLKDQSRARVFGVFSAYARTTRGGVDQSGSRAGTSGSNIPFPHGRLAGKPFLFHNPASGLVSMNLANEKLGGQSHELNLQVFRDQGEWEGYLSADDINRAPYLSGNTSSYGVKSGSYLELTTGPMQTIADFRRSNALSSPFLPSFVQPVGNSLVSPLMSTDSVIQKDSSVAAYDLMDHSVLANHALYDRFYFSTFATQGRLSPSDSFEKFMNGTAPLLNQSFKSYLPSGKTAKDAKDEMYRGSKPTDTAYQIASEYQMVRGPFNVNSTNVEAWKAVLASMSNSEVYTLWGKSLNLEGKRSEGATILPMSLPNGGNFNESFNGNNVDDIQSHEWNGYRDLNAKELDTLAEKIVAEVRDRGPFLSMSEFVNRQIGRNSDKSRQGALEAAIDKSGVNAKRFTQEVAIRTIDLSNTSLYNYKTPEASTGNPAAGAPGWLSQGDLMRILEPSATVRSDTFVIRVYGDAVDKTGKNVLARAYAEAVVQRLPEYVDPTNRPSLNAYTDNGASETNKTFGRRMSLVSFRWLSANEI
jgi:hypothetical protein